MSTISGTQHGAGGCKGIFRRLPGAERESPAKGMGWARVACDKCGTDSADFWFFPPGKENDEPQDYDRRAETRNADPGSGD